MTALTERYEAGPGTVIVSLSEQIFSALKSKSYEESQPTKNPDESDYYIKSLETRIEVLTRLRAEYELEMSRSLSL